MTATAVVSSMDSPAAFKDGREFAAWIDLVPRQTGTGGRARQLGISSRELLADAVDARSKGDRQIGSSNDLAVARRAA